MINAYYSAKSGILNNQNSLNVTSNNIANINTTAFKAQRPNFTDLLYTNFENAQTETPQNLQNGNGVRVQEVATLFTQGVVTPTGRFLDMAIQGDGFFCLEDGEGKISYTRAGSFGVANGEDGSNYLVSAGGEYVLDENMQRIVLEGDINSIQLTAPTGQGSNDKSIALAVVTFKNPYALTQVGDSRYAASDASGEAELMEKASVMQGAIERSSVDLATEMQRLMESQRGFQFSAKVLQVTDEIEQMANTLRT